MIETERLILRPFLERDRAAMRTLWGDATITAELSGPRTDEETDAIVARHEGYRASHGLGFWVLERRTDHALIGYAGLKPGAEDTPIAGEVEIGWVLERDAWGYGYATEAAQAALTWAWASYDAARVMAITSNRNSASRRVMERLGMRHIGDFEHARYPAGDPSRRSVIYAIDRPA